jgi:hypothetical protein
MKKAFSFSQGLCPGPHWGPWAKPLSMAIANNWGFVRIEPHGGSRNGKGKEE